MDPNEIINIYENLRKEAQANTIETGVENLSFNELEWRIVNNPDNRSKDLIVTLNVCDKRESLTIPFHSIRKDLAMETNRIARLKVIREFINKKLTEFIAYKITNQLMRAANAVNE